MSGLLDPGSHEAGRIVEAFVDAAREQARPSVVYRAELLEGTPGSREQWAAFKGTLVTYGPTPGEAMRRFDQAWAGFPCGRFLGARQPRLGEDIAPGYATVNSYCSRPATHDGPCEDEA